MSEIMVNASTARFTIRDRELIAEERQELARLAHSVTLVASDILASSGLQMEHALDEVTPGFAVPPMNSIVFVTSE